MEMGDLFTIDVATLPPWWLFWKPLKIARQAFRVTGGGSQAAWVSGESVTLDGGVVPVHLADNAWMAK